MRVRSRQTAGGKHAPERVAEALSRRHVGEVRQSREAEDVEDDRDGDEYNVHDLEVLDFGVEVVSGDDDEQQRPVDHVDGEEEIESLRREA